MANRDLVGFLRPYPEEPHPCWDAGFGLGRTCYLEASDDPGPYCVDGEIWDWVLCTPSDAEPCDASETDGWELIATKKYLTLAPGAETHHHRTPDRAGTWEIMLCVHNWIVKGDPTVGYGQRAGRTIAPAARIMCFGVGQRGEVLFFAELAADWFKTAMVAVEPDCVGKTFKISRMWDGDIVWRARLTWLTVAHVDPQCVH